MSQQNGTSSLQKTKQVLFPNEGQKQRKTDFLKAQGIEVGESENEDNETNK